MSTQYAPVYAKDLNQYIVPGLASDTVEQAVIAGGEAQLQNTYGLVPNGEVVSLENGQYPGPYIIATVGDKTAWIIGGPTFESLTADRHPAVENLSKYDAPEQTQPVNDDDGALGALASAIIAEAASQVLDTPAADPTPEFGGGGGTDGAGAGGTF